jgi:hypothetical protein
MNEMQTPWHRELNRYHWFVLIVAALGWLFDCLDQQLFILARQPAMHDLLRSSIQFFALAICVIVVIR